MATNLSPHLHRVLKTLRAGGTLKLEDGKWTCRYKPASPPGIGGIMSTLSADSMDKLQKSGEIESWSTGEFVLKGIEQVFTPTGRKPLDEATLDRFKIDEVPEPLPVPMMVATAVMVRRPELLKLQPFPLSEQDQRAVVALIGDMIRELEIKDARVKQLEGQITAAQNLYSELHEIRLNLTEKITQVGHVLRKNPEPDEEDDGE